MKTRYGFLIDLRRCIGCHTCSVVCKNENDVPLGVWRTWLKTIEKGRYPEVTKSFLPLLCNNCSNPVCCTVCPVHATRQQENGVVTINPHRCIGCRYCMAACPYRVRYINPLKNIAEKCDWCYHRLRIGQRPACVEACPTEAMRFGNLADPADPISRLIATHPVDNLLTEKGTYPQAYYIGLDNQVVEARSPRGDEP